MLDRVLKDKAWYSAGERRKWLALISAGLLIPLHVNRTQVTENMSRNKDLEEFIYSMQIFSATTMVINFFAYVLVSMLLEIWEENRKRKATTLP
jgi:hypothetical protein